MPAIDLDKYRKAPKKAEQDQQQVEAPLTQAEIVRRQMLARHHRLRQVGHEKVNFNYLDIYEEQAQHQRKMEQAFQEREKIIEGENEANRPAFFQRDERMEELRKKQINEGLEPWRQEEYDAYKQMQEKTEVDFTKDEFQDHEKVRDYFKISKEKGMVDDMNDKAFDFLYSRMKERQLTFYAFLNKEFNTMNYKSARCSMHCFDDEEKPLKEVNNCLKICRHGIEGCKDYAFNL